jgi:hypothetical protein
MYTKFLPVNLKGTSDPRYRWKYNIKMNFKINSARERFPRKANVGQIMIHFHLVPKFEIRKS